MMNLVGSQRSIMTSFVFVFIILPLGIVADDEKPKNLPSWNEAEWATELEMVRQKYSPDVKGGADGPIPRLVKCALDLPRDGFPRCGPRQRKVFVNEILLRKQYKGHNEDCNSHGTQEDHILVNPPKRVTEFAQSGEFEFESYLDWQEKLINSKQQFCDPLKFLRCSAEHKCICHLRSTWSPPNDARRENQDRNTCAFSHASECSMMNSIIGPFDGQQYFDPFKANGDQSGYEVQVVTPPCRKKHDNCYDGEYLKEPTCLPTVSFLYQITTLENWLAVTVLPPLLFNDDCNFQDHNAFFTSVNENYELRFQNVEAIRVRGTKFCDLEKFLTCGPFEKCECMPPASRKNDKCVLPEEYDKCSLNPKMEPVIMNKSIIWKAREKLMTGIANIASGITCEGKLRCHADMMELYCTCPPGKTGQECDETLTKFLEVVRAPSLPNDVVGYPEQIKTFRKFNEKALEFEKIFKLREQTACVWETQNEAETIVGRIRKLSYRETSMTTGQYDDLTRSIQAFTNKHQSKGICNETLRCQYSTKTCVRLNRRDYLQDLHQSLEKSETLKCNETGCSVFPNHHNDIMYGVGEFQFYGGDHEMEYSRIIREHFDLSRTKAKFCAVGGSCSDSIPRTCDCQGMNNTTHRPNTTNMTQSSAHCRHHLNQFIFLMSVTVFFVASKY